MTVVPWASVLSGLSPCEATDLDAPSEGSAVAVVEAGWPSARPAPPQPSPLLYWPVGADARVAIGIRVNRPLADPVVVALHLASAAAERDVQPVILTTLPYTGLERFGFRVERLPETDTAEQARCEAELAAFWNLAIVIDADDVCNLG